MPGKILLITTGGTISLGLRTRGPATGSEILAAMPEAVTGAQIELLDLLAISSSQVSPEDMLLLSKAAHARLAGGGWAGCILTHGTDSLEETAQFLDLVYDLEIPLVVTGAMRSGREAGPDGAANLRASVAVCLDSCSLGRGVLVVFNEQIHKPRFVTKTHTKDVSAFQSLDVGPEGIVYGGNVVYFHSPGPKRAPLRVERLDARVDLLKSYSGADGALVEAAIAAGARGLVIEGMGRGNLPPELAQAAADASARGLVVVITTRCGSGPVTCPQALREAGAIPAGLGYNGQKARIAVLLGLSAGLARPDLAELLR